MNKKFIITVLLLSGLAGFLLSLYLHQETPPLSDVRLIQTFHRPAIFVKQLVGDRDAGRKIFKEFCASCHDKQPIIDVNAPRIGDKQAWLVRRKWGLKVLSNLTMTGVGAMPARGGCFECSDDQLNLAIQYILDKSR